LPATDNGQLTNKLFLLFVAACLCYAQITVKGFGRVSAMKRLPYSFPEVAFIFLEMLLPLAVGFIWRSETFWGFVGKVVGNMVVGFLIWLGMILVVCRNFDRKKKVEKTQA
jgi:hypothetical protein